MMALRSVTLKIGTLTNLGLFFPVLCFIYVFRQTLAEQLYPDKGLLLYLQQMRVLRMRETKKSTQLTSSETCIESSSTAPSSMVSFSSSKRPFTSDNLDALLGGVLEKSEVSDELSPPGVNPGLIKWDCFRNRSSCALYMSSSSSSLPLINSGLSCPSGGALSSVLSFSIISRGTSVEPVASLPSSELELRLFNEASS